eukprot:g78255.t1
MQILITYQHMEQVKIFADFHSYTVVCPTLAGVFRFLTRPYFEFSLLICGPPIFMEIFGLNYFLQLYQIPEQKQIFVC